MSTQVLDKIGINVRQINTTYNYRIKVYIRSIEVTHYDKCIKPKPEAKEKKFMPHMTYDDFLQYQYWLEFDIDHDFYPEHYNKWHKKAYEKYQTEYMEYYLHYTDEQEFEYNKYKEQLQRNKDRSKQVSVNRTREKIIDYAKSNDFKYFVTFTFDADKVNRYNMDEVAAKMSKWLRNYKSRKAPDLKYLIVPELHQDGAVHYHALMTGIDENQLIWTGVYSYGKLNFKFKGDKLQVGNKLLEYEQVVKDETKLKKVYNIKDFKLGYTTATTVEDIDRTAGYISKYITKELIQEKNKKRYWCSKDLKQPEVYKIDIPDDMEIIKKLENISNYTKKIVVKIDDYENEIDIYNIKIK